MSPYAAAPYLAARMFRPGDDDRLVEARHDARVRRAARRARRRLRGS